jgi:hypothetical protein
VKPTVLPPKDRAAMLERIAELTERLKAREEPAK